MGGTFPGCSEIDICACISTRVGEQGEGDGHIMLVFCGRPRAFPPVFVEAAVMLGDIGCATKINAAPG